MLLIELAAGVSGLGLAFLVWEVAQGLRNWQWPRTEGIVLHSSSEALPNNKKERRIAVIYEYAVGDKTYRSQRLRVSPIRVASADVADRTAGAYPVGKTVSVRYHPVIHRYAVLEPGLFDRKLYVVLLAIFLVVFLSSTLAIIGSTF